MSTLHGKTVVTADDGASEVGSDEWNAGHNTSLTGGEVMAQPERFVAASTQRLTVADVARLQLLEDAGGLRGSFSVNTLDILNDTWFLQYKRTGLSGNARLSVFGTAELYLFDLAPVGRLTLAGRGI